MVEAVIFIFPLFDGFHSMNGFSKDDQFGVNDKVKIMQSLDFFLRALFYTMFMLHLYAAKLLNLVNEFWSDACQ